MEIKGQQPLSVIEHDTITFEIQRASQKNRSGIYCRHWRAGRGCEIESLVHALNLAVKRTAGTEDVGNRHIDRRTKFSGPLALRIGVLKHVLLDRLVLVNAFQLFLAGFSEPFGDGHGDAGILRRPNRNIFEKLISADWRLFPSAPECRFPDEFPD